MDDCNATDGGGKWEIKCRSCGARCAPAGVVKPDAHFGKVVVVRYRCACGLPAIVPYCRKPVTKHLGPDDPLGRVSWIGDFEAYADYDDSIFSDLPGWEGAR